MPQHRTDARPRGGASPDVPLSRLGTLLTGCCSVVLWLLIGLLTLIFSSATMICSVCLFLVDPQRKVAHRIASLWGRAILRCNPLWKVTVTGRRHLPPRTACILVANHQSMLDIMAGFCLNRQFKWVSKASLFGIPFMGWAMASVRYIKLYRGNYHSIRDTYEQAKQWLSAGMPVFFFPEGTRSSTGELGTFKMGAFKLAVESGTPVVPIVITGTRDLLRRGSWLFRPRAHVRVTVLPPLEPHENPDRLRDDVHRCIRQALERSSDS